MSKILVVEDHPESRYLLERLLASRGHHVTAAQNGEEALRLAREEPPDVIISDIMMPVMNGFRLCSQVKNDPFLRHIPFIFYTATFVDKTDEKLAMGLGASRFVVKPTEGDQFIQILDDVMEEQRDGILPVPEGPLEDQDVLLEMYENSITRKLAETVEKLQDERNALIQSERRLKEAQELAHIGHWELDLKTDSLEWSDEIYRILGVKPRAFDPSYKTVTTMEVIHPDDRADVAKAHKEALAKKTPCDIEYRLLLKDGTVKYVNERFQTLYDDEGMPTCSMGTVQDITERKRAEEALNKGEALLKETQALTKVGGWELDVATGHITWTDEVYRIYGVTPGDYDPSDVARNMSFYAPDEIPVMKQALERALSHREAYDLDLEFIRANGERIWVRTIGRPGVKDGKVVRVAGNFMDITEQKKIEGDLREGEERYRAMFDNIMNGVAIYRAENNGEDFVFIDFNKSAEKMEHIEKEDLIGKSVLEVFPSVKDFGLFDVFQRVWKTGKPESHSVAQYRDERISGWRENFVYKLPSGEIVSVYSDETERKQAEEALREAESLYRLHFENVSDVIYSVDRELKLINISPSVERILGYKPEELIGRPIQELNVLAPESLEQAASDIMRVLGGQRIPSTEYQFIARDDTRRWGEVSGAPLIRDGQVVAVISVARDITDRREAEKALKEAYDIISRSSSVAFIWKNQEGWPVAFVSENVERLFGYTSEEFIKGDVIYVACIHPEDLERFAREVAECSNQKESTEVLHEPYRIIAKDGAEKTINDWSYIVRDRDGRITHYKGIVEDITERKEAEEERERLQAQLHQAQKMESVGRLAGGVAHDFNNMLSVIQGRTELALLHVDPEDPLHASLQEISKAARRSSNVTRQLLAFARKQTIAPEVLNLNDTVEGMLKMLRRLIGEDINLTWQPDTNLWPVNMDSAQIDQILANLCVNARDAISGVGRVAIETANVVMDAASCEKHAECVPGEYVMLGVSDDGSGMDKETLDNAFEPFFTTKEVGKGTGLGLATVYGIVKQNQGFINVASEPGKGTTFRIYLPRYGGKTEEGVETAKTEIPRGHGETILIVEDEVSVLDVGKEILERMGYTVLAAGSPGEAMSISQRYSGEIDLLMTDVVLPEMSGKDLAEGMTRIRPKTRIMFMSGYTADIIGHRGILDKGVHFVQKPFTPDSLARKVREVLDNA